MEGSVAMARIVGYTEQLEILEQYMLDEMSRLDSPPRE